MTRLALIRHGPTEWTQRKRLQGHRDIPLSEQGRAMVRGWRLPAWAATSRWYVSPLVRARETAAILGHKDAQIEPRLIEMSWGLWEGENLENLRTELGPEMRDNEARGFDFRPEGGESPRELLARIQPWLREISLSKDPAIAVVHKGTIRTLIATASNWDLTGKPPVKIRWGTCHLFRIERDGGLVMETPVGLMDSTT